MFILLIAGFLAVPYGKYIFLNMLNFPRKWHIFISQQISNF